MSAWASAHGGDDDEPRNVTPGRAMRSAKRNPALEAILQEHDAAALRAGKHQKQAVGHLWRAAVAFFLSTVPLPHPLGVVLFWMTVVFLLAASGDFYHYRCARIETSIWPD